MTCREVSNLLPLFLDGELDPRQMRVVALHSTRCVSCEAELRRMERVQELVSEFVTARVDEIDLSDFWSRIEGRLQTARVSWWQRARAWWSEGESEWNLGLPAIAAAAAIAVLAMLFLLRSPQPTTAPNAPQLAAVDEAASIEALDTDFSSVAVVNDPETLTTVLWVSDDVPTGGDGQ